MQSKVKTCEEKKYPWLGHGAIGDGGWEKVVLFTDRNEGIVVAAIGSNVVLGEMCMDWNEESFIPFTGTIELSN